MEKNARKKMWSVAKRHGWSCARVAAIINQEAKTIDAVINRGTQGGACAPAFDAWLIKNANKYPSGYEPEIIDEDAQNWLGGLPDRIIGLGKDLKGVRLDDSEKLQSLVGFVSELNQNLDRYIVAFEKIHKSHD